MLRRFHLKHPGRKIRFCLNHLNSTFGNSCHILRHKRDKDMFQSIMSRVDDHHALSSRINGIMVTDISGNQYLRFLFQCITDHAATGSG